MLLGIEIHCGEEQSMCDPKDTVGVDHVVQILRVCGFSVVQYDKEHDLGDGFSSFCS